MNFRKENFVKESLKRSATITKVNLLKFKALPSQPETRKAKTKARKKELSLVQQQIDIVKSRGITMKEIFTLDLV